METEPGSTCPKDVGEGFILRLNQFVYAPFYALTIVGPIAKFIDLKYFAKK